ncbi:choice-of-anchor D domain-containing protein [Kribbella monticola]|uniref:choice-of-anchor D domain-containing protein n=1 Tax=Kribbella monticola TaxID=2185285 RepID=UPI000DD2F9E2|nr:choice-of-anchor D domain-containing protein [Kribbella monticola]
MSHNLRRLVALTVAASLPLATTTPATGTGTPPLSAAFTRPTTGETSTGSTSARTTSAGHTSAGTTSAGETSAGTTYAGASTGRTTSAGLPTSVAVSRADTQAISVPDGGAQSAASAAGSPAISGTGRYVAFQSAATLDPTVLASPPGVQNVYVRDRRQNRTVQVSRAPLTTYLTATRGNSVPIRRPAAPADRSATAVEDGGNRDSAAPSISADGRYIAFQSSATNLPDSFPAYGVHVVLCDRDPDGDGLFDERRPDGTMDFGFRYLSTPPEDELAPEGTAPSLSADATTVAWTERAAGSSSAGVVITQLHKDAQGRPLAPDPALFRRPLQDIDNAVGTQQAAKLSADGQHVVFTANLCQGTCCELCAPNEPDGPVASVQVYDLSTSLSSRVDFTTDGGYSGLGSHPVVSGSGRLIAFEQLPRPEGPTVTVVVDRDPAATGRLGPADGLPVLTSVASRAVTGQPQEGLSPALSADGRYIAFASSADGMHADQQGTGRMAIVLRDLTLDNEREKNGLPRLPGELGSPAAHCEDAAESLACPAAGPSASPGLSADGLVVTFTSAGDDVQPEPCCAGAAFAREFHPGLTSAPPTFGTVALGNTTARTVVLEHTGFGPLPVQGLSITGPNADDFKLTGAGTCAAAILHETDTCAVEISFAPTATGNLQAVLRISLSGGTFSETPLTAEAVPAEPGQPPQPTGALVITPDPVTFTTPQRSLVESSARTIIVRNAATVPIAVTSIKLLEGRLLTLGDFTVRRTTCASTTLDPGETCSIDLSTTPQNAGPRNGVLRIGTTDPQYDKLISLHSQGIQPVLVVNPAVVRLNRVVQISGRDFPPNHPVTVALATPGSRTFLNLQTTAEGTFTIPLLVFPQTSAGTSPVVATAGGTSIRAQTPLLIVPGSYQPPGFTSRR